MSEQKSVGDASQDAGGKTEDTSNDVVRYELFDKAVKQYKREKETRSQLENELNSLKEAKLKEQNEWKTLYEQEKAQRAELATTLQSQEEAILKNLKYSAFEKHLGGRIVDDAYQAFVPFEKIVIDPDTKMVNEDSVKLAVSDFVKKHSKLVEFQSSKMPNAAPSSYGNIQSKPFEQMSKEEIEKELLSRFK